MLTIGQLADYVGVTPRAIRHYHRIGLLAEPDRTPAGYRSYTAEDVIDLQRIKVLTDAGVPLARVRELIDAGPEGLQVAVAELDATLRDRIRALRQTRRSLAALADGREPFLPPELVDLHERMRGFGVSERTIAMERDAWILVQALYPDLLLPWLRSQSAMLDDPAFRELYLLTDQAFDWPADDPRIEDLARLSLAVGRTTYDQLAGDADLTAWEDDDTAAWLVLNYRRDTSPGWRRLLERIEELAAEAGPDSPH